MYRIVITVLNSAAVMGCLSSCRLLYDKGAFSVKKSSAYYEAVHSTERKHGCIDHYHRTENHDIFLA